MTGSSDPAPAKESFGRYLAQQRELRGLTLEQIGDSTKLSLTTLRALESDDSARLPERVFLVGAVRAYSKAIGLSPEETLLRLHEWWGTPPGGSTPLAVRAKPVAVGRWAAVALIVAALVALTWRLVR